ncbi:22550_t:CDS:2, partial [Racocetra persica]
QVATMCPWHINLSCPLRDNPGFRDLYVEIQRYRPSNNVIKNDASHFYDQLLSKQQEDSRWFIEITWEDETNTLTNLFWMSPEQILLWYEFGESIGHDNTASTNRYNMPLSLFVAQDDNMQSRIIAQALVSNETAETYQWVLQMTKKATNNRYPNVFVTD